MKTMRESLLGSFNEIFVLNLHGVGSGDENVFNIKQPVSITFFVKTKAVKEECKVYYQEVSGDRQSKLNLLSNFDISLFKEIYLNKDILFLKEDGNLRLEYEKNSFDLDEFFSFHSHGIQTNADDLVTDTDRNNLLTKITDFQTKGWLPEKIENGVESEHTGKIRLRALKNKNGIVKSFPYRPFDTRFIYDSAMVHRRKKELTQHEQVKENLYLSFKASVADKSNFSHILITKSTIDTNFFSGATHTAPLYLSAPNVIDPSAPQFKSNLNTTITAKFTSLDSSITDLDIVDYIYGVLNDKAYTTKYNQFLKSNYPRVPYPQSIDTFIQYKDAGSKLRVIHLDDTTQDTTSTYNATTNNKIEKIFFDTDKVYFNKTSYFDNISQAMFDFKIGASQPLKNWLESRKDDTFDQTMIEQYLNVIYKVRHSC